MSTRPHPHVAGHHANPRHDRLFFSAAAALLIATWCLGFAPSYFLAGMVGAHLPSAVVHVHAGVATAWLLLLAVQVSLVSAHRVDLHRRLGMAGFLLAAALVVSGLLSAADTLRRDVPPGASHLLFLINVSMAGMFAGLMTLAYRARTDPPSHRRLILIANVALTFAGVVRWPVEPFFHDIGLALRAPYVLVLLLVLYDLWSARRLHPVTLWAGALLVVVFEAQSFIADTMAWRAVSAWVGAAGG